VLCLLATRASRARASAAIRTLHARYANQSKRMLCFAHACSACSLREQAEHAQAPRYALCMLATLTNRSACSASLTRALLARVASKQSTRKRLNKTEGRLSRSLVRLRRTEGGPVGAHQFGCVATQGFVKPRARSCLG